MSNQSTVSYREIPDFPGYRVGDDGSVWSRRPRNGKGNLKEKWRVLKPSIDSGGYLYVGLRVANKNAKRIRVARLVLASFVGEPPPEHEACHNNGNPRDNRLSNLRWDSRWRNCLDTIAHEHTTRGTKSSKAKLCEQDILVIRSRLASGESASAMAKEFRVSPQHVRAIGRGKFWGWLK